VNTHQTRDLFFIKKAKTAMVAGKLNAGLAEETCLFISADGQRTVK